MAPKRKYRREVKEIECELTLDDENRSTTKDQDEEEEEEDGPSSEAEDGPSPEAEAQRIEDEKAVQMVADAKQAAQKVVKLAAATLRAATDAAEKEARANPFKRQKRFVAVAIEALDSALVAFSATGPPVVQFAGDGVELKKPLPAQTVSIPTSAELKKVKQDAKPDSDDDDETYAELPTEDQKRGYLVAVAKFKDPVAAKRLEKRYTLTRDQKEAKYYSEYMKWRPAYQVGFERAVIACFIRDHLPHDTLKYAKAVARLLKSMRGDHAASHLGCKNPDQLETWDTDVESAFKAYGGRSLTMRYRAVVFHTLSTIGSHAALGSDAYGIIHPHVAVFLRALPTHPDDV